MGLFKRFTVDRPLVLVLHEKRHGIMSNLKSSLHAVAEALK